MQRPCMNSAGEQWLALRMDEEVRTLLGKLGLEITLRQWEEYIGACQALPAEAPNVWRSLDMRLLAVISNSSCCLIGRLSTSH